MHCTQLIDIDVELFIKDQTTVDDEGQIKVSNESAIHFIM